MEVYAPTSKEPYSISEFNNKSRAVLPRPKGQIDYHKTALTLMNMIENILTRGNEVRITTKDSTLAKIADLYIEHLKSLDLPCSYHPSEAAKRDKNDSAKTIFENIIKQIPPPNHPPTPWFTKALTLKPEPDLELAIRAVK